MIPSPPLHLVLIIHHQTRIALFIEFPFVVLKWHRFWAREWRKSLPSVARLMKWGARRPDVSVQGSDETFAAFIFLKFLFLNIPVPIPLFPADSSGRKHPPMTWNVSISSIWPNCCKQLLKLLLLKLLKNLKLLKLLPLHLTPRVNDANNSKNKQTIQWKRSTKRTQTQTPKKTRWDNKNQKKEMKPRRFSPAAIAAITVLNFSHFRFTFLIELESIHHCVAAFCIPLTALNITTWHIWFLYGCA